jgi:hypothetical protein
MNFALNFLVSMAMTFLAFSVMVSAATELWSAGRGTRGSFLWRGIARMMGEGPVADAMLEKLRAHASIRALSQNDRPTCLASYIPASVFAAALCEVLLAQGNPDGLARYGPGEAIASLPQELTIKRILSAAWQRARGDRVEFEREIGKYFDMSMDRVSGWYKRHTQVRSLCIGLVLALTLNIDAVHIASALWSNHALAATVADGGQKMADHYAAADPLTPQKGTSQNANGTALPPELPVGWPARWSTEPSVHSSAWHWWATALGIVIMALSCLVGAPMWYQLLSMLLPLRAAGAVPARGPTPASLAAESNGQRDALPAVENNSTNPAPPVLPGAACNLLEASLVESGQLATIQQLLGVAPSGVFDAATRSAIRAAQGKAQFAITGQLTRLLIERIESAAPLATSPIIN